MIPFNRTAGEWEPNSTICSRQWVAANCAAMVVLPSLPAVAGATFGSAKVLLTPSCTASLEMAALLLDIQPGDEVIMPSYTFVSPPMPLCCVARKSSLWMFARTP